jgi:hypothetical protein
MAATLQDLRDQFYSLLNETEGASNYPLALADSLLNNKQRQILNGSVVMSGTKEAIEKGRLPFITTDKFYLSAPDQYLTIDLSAGSTTVTVNDTTGYSVPGVLWIEGEKVTYTGVTATEFTGVPATGDGSIAIDHNSGARIGQLYALPTDYATATRLTYNNGYVLPFVKEEDIVLQYNNRKDWRMLDPSGSSTQGQRPIFLRPPFYTVVHGTWLLPMNITAANSQLWLQYEKKPATMTDLAPTVTIPEEWATMTIPVLAAGEMKLIRGEQDTGKALLFDAAYPTILAMYEFYDKQHGEENYGQRVKTYADRSGYNI